MKKQPIRERIIKKLGGYTNDEIFTAIKNAEMKTERELKRFRPLYPGTVRVAAAFEVDRCAAEHGYGPPEDMIRQDLTRKIFNRIKEDNLIHIVQLPEEISGQDRIRYIATLRIIDQ